MECSLSSTTTDVLIAVQVGYGTDAGRHGVISTVAICAGSGGSMLVGKKADVYFTGEMAHVSSLNNRCAP